MKSNNWFLILIISIAIGVCHLQADANPLDDHGDTWKVATDIFFDAPQPGQINLPGDIDYFRLEITEPGELTVYTTGSLDTIGSIEDDTGVAFIEGDQEGDGNNFRIVCNAKPETYYIRVRGYENATGDYTLHTSFAPDPEVPLVPDAETPVDTPQIADDHGDMYKVATELFFDIPQTGQINPVGDVDYFLLEIPEPGELTVYTTGSLDTIGSVEDDAGVFANGDQEGDGNNFRIVCYAKPETYYIRVRGYENATGDYTLHASFVPGAEPSPVQLQNIVPDPENHTRATASRITLNSSRNAAISPAGDTDYWRFEASASSSRFVVIQTTGSLDTIGRLESSSGRVLATNDDSGVGSNFRMVVEVITGGTFYILVAAHSSRATGSYTLHVHTDGNYARATADSLSLNGSQTNYSIGYVGDIDYFRVRVTTAGQLTVYTTGSTDTYGRLENSGGNLYNAGNILASNDDGGVGTNFKIVRTVVPGTYYIRVSGVGSRTGSYNIYADFGGTPPASDDHGNTRATATFLSLNSPLTGRIDPARDIDYFRLQVPVAGELTVYTTGSTDTVGRLENSSGSPLASNDDGGVGTNFRIVRDVTAGTYYIRVHEFANNQTGNYRIQASMGSADDHGNTRATATSLSLDSPLTGRIDPAGDIDYFRVRVTASGPLTVETTGSTDTVGHLENSSGELLAKSDDAGVDTNFKIVHNVAPGTYYIRVAGYETRIGSYTLQANMGSTNVDVNGDGVVDIGDLIIAVTHYGARNVTFEQGDVNGDNVVDRADFLAILDVLDSRSAAAPSIHQKKQSFPVESLRRWIDQAKQLNTTDANFQKGIAVLEQLLARLIEAETIPTATAVLPNYPNPFNPETWIPYQLAKPADVTVRIYDINGRVVRYLDVGHQRAGLYHSRSRAMHWDGRNTQGESVASGVYFYTLTAGDFTATRKLLIAK